MNNISKDKIKILWKILDDSEPFIKKNRSYGDFIKRFDIPFFEKYKEEKGMSPDQWNSWKKAYFISSLSSDEINLVIELYQQRDYTFDLDI
jgi:hypothetical protein